MFHLSPPMTHFRIKEDELRALGQVKGDASVANGNGSSSNSSTASCATITPNDITSKIVECVMAMSAVAQYNGNKVCIKRVHGMDEICNIVCKSHLVVFVVFVSQ